LRHRPAAPVCASVNASLPISLLFVVPFSRRFSAGWIAVSAKRIFQGNAVDTMGLLGFTEDRAKRRSRVHDLMAAAAGGSVEAQIALAWHYVRGEFVPRSLVKANTWLERAAASGEEEAAVQRARFLQLRRVPQGSRELRGFAARGNWKAQFWLAQHYEARPHRISRLKAVVWYDRSSGNGNLVARAAKFMLLTRLAPMLSKPMFAAAALREKALALRRLTASRRRTGRYDALRYRLERRSW
jgi:hypothetical protein